MIKNNVAVVTAGLCGNNNGYRFQQKNYNSLLINGSVQDNKAIPEAKNILVLEGYDGLGGDRSLAYEALKNNKEIIKKIQDIKEKVILFIASGGGTTGSACIPLLADIACQLKDKIVCAVLVMPRRDEPIQKRLNAYNTAKELMEIDEMGAIFLVNNEYSTDLDKINFHLVNMLDAFFTDNSTSSASNFDDSEKYKMLSDHGCFYIAMRCDKPDSTEKVTTQDMINALTAKNIFLPFNNDGVVTHIGIINQKGNHVNEQEIIKAVGNPENIFIGNNGTANIVCVSGCSFPVEYISSLGKKALSEQKERISKRKSLSLLDDLEEIEEEIPVQTSKINKRRKISLDLMRELD
jgi:hypothetical protein